MSSGFLVYMRALGKTSMPSDTWEWEHGPTYPWRHHCLQLCWKQDCAGDRGWAGIMLNHPINAKDPESVGKHLIGKKDHEFKNQIHTKIFSWPKLRLASILWLQFAIIYTHISIFILFWVSLCLTPLPAQIPVRWGLNPFTYCIFTAQHSTWN